MATSYRKPTEQEEAKLEKSRELMNRGIEDEKGIMARLMPTMAKSARDDIRAAKQMRESVPAAAREYEAYNEAGYKMGGKVSSASSRADGCAQRGKTRGTIVAMCGGGMSKGRK